MLPSAAAVVRLGALCGLQQAPTETPDGTCHWWVGEFAVLADGRRVVLHDERGFSVSAPIGPGVGPRTRHAAWHMARDRTARDRMARDEVVRTVLNVVLPDDESPAEDHPDEWLASLAQQRGLAVTADELRAVPYAVVLTADAEALCA